MEASVVTQCERLRAPGIHPLSSTDLQGNFERYNIARNRNRFYNNVGATASYEISNTLLSEHGLEAVTFSALRRTINRHPSLGIGILDEDSLTPSWVRLPEIDLKKVVRIESLDGETDSRRYDGIIEGEHRIPFENVGDLPLWRVVLITRRTSPSNHQLTAGSTTVDVGFFWHHGIGDGGSGIAFHLEFLDALNGIGNDTPVLSDAIVVPPKVDLLPSIEERHPLPLSIFFLFRQLFKMILPKRVDNLLWTGPPLRSEKNITHLRTLFLPDSVVQILVRLCRENNVTITALIVVVIARILATTYRDYRHFTCKTAMSFRRFTKTDNRDMVNYVSSICHRFSSDSKSGYINCGGEFKWSAVKACKRDIDAATASPKNHGIGLLKYLNDYGTWMRNLIGGRRLESFEVSNIGVMDGGLDQQSNAAKVKRLLFSQSSNVMGPAYVFNMATVKGGDLAVALTWQEGVLDDEVAEKVLMELGTELSGLCKDQ
jgi:hypothetical protein